MSNLREKVIRLAHEKPELRKHLLPLVTKTTSRRASLDQNTLGQLIEMAQESISEDGDYETVYKVPSDVLRAAKNYERAVAKAIGAFAKKNLGMFTDMDDVDDVVSTLMGEEAAYLYYMEMVGHGVGTWDGRWRHLMESSRDIDALSKFVGRATARDGEKLQDAIEDSAHEINDQRE